MGRRIDIAPLLAGLGGLALVISLFLHWYEPHMSAWIAFEVWDLVLALLGLAAAWVAGSQLVLDTPPREGSLPLVGGAALVIVVSQLVNHPPAAQGASLQLGAWIALAGSVLMASGGILSVANVSLSVSFAPREPDDGALVPAPRRPREPSPANEAAAVEPEVHDELYPVEERSGPIGADDPELWSDPAEDDTLPFDREGEERS
jgi:hypothetical protein